MVILRAKQGKYIYLSALILIQIVGFHLVNANIKCIQCGGNGANCSENDQPKDCPAYGTEKCFIKIDANGVIERGCLKEENTCVINSISKCIPTEESKNNQLICKTCAGDEAKCSQTDMNNNDLTFNQICDATAKNCFVKVENKLVVRGCGNNTQCTGTNQNTCKTCSSDNCNTGMFPPNRISCYQCSGSKCDNVTGNEQLSKPCLNYDEKDECYTLSDSDKSIRGCKSDTKDNKCSTDAQGCAFCNTANCNKESYEFTCIVCRSDLEKKCWNDATQLKGQKCRNSTGSSEGCFSGVWYGVAIRGCVSDASAQTQTICKDKNNQQCTSCNTKDCNTGKSSGAKNGLSYSLLLIVLITLCKFK